MLKKSVLFFIIIFFCASLLPAQRYRIKYSTDDKEPISLENAIRLALENNYELLLTEQDVIIAEQRLKEARFLYLPQISLNAGATMYNLDYPTVLPENLGLRLITPYDGHKNSDLFYAVGVSATQYLYTGGRNSSTVSLANAALKESKSRYEAVRTSVIFETKKAFWEYLFLQRKKQILLEISAKARAVLPKAKIKKWEQVLVDADMAGMDSEISNVEAELNAAYLRLLSVLNKELNTNINLSGTFEFSPVEVDLDKITMWAMEFRPELKSALYKLEMDNIAVKLSLAKRYPDVMLGFGYDRLGDERFGDENFHVTLGMQLPIGYDYGTQIRQKRAEQRQTILRRSAIEDAIRLQVRTSYNNLMYWQQETAVRREILKNISAQLKGIENSGLKNEDIVKTFDYYYKTGVGYLEGIKRHVLAIAELELAVGRDIRN